MSLNQAFRNQELSLQFLAANGSFGGGRAKEIRTIIRSTRGFFRRLALFAVVAAMLVTIGFRTASAQSSMSTIAADVIAARLHQEAGKDSTGSGGSATVGTDAAGAAAEKPDKTIFVPYKNLRETLEKLGAAKTVLIPFDTLMSLINKANANPAPVVLNAVITSATYTASIEKDMARIQAEYTIKVLGKPWVEVPLRFGDAAVGKFSAGDTGILLQGTGPGTYSLLIPTAGEHKVTLELMARVKTAPEGRSFELAIPTSPITSFDLTVPAADQTIEVLPYLAELVPAAAAPTDAAAASTRVSVALGSSDRVAARWFPRVSTAPVMELLTSAVNTLDVRVADGLVHTEARINYQVLRGEVDQFRIAVPKADRILDVTAQGLKAWRIESEEARQVIIVDLLNRNARQVQIEVHCERPVGTEPIEFGGVTDTGAVYGIHPLDVARESGTISIGHASDLTLAVEQQTGAVRIPEAESPESVRRANTLHYKYFSPKFRILGVVKPVEPRVTANANSLLVFNDDELTFRGSFTFTVDQGTVFEQRFKLPADFVVDDVQCEGMKEFQSPAGSNQLIVLLNQATSQQFSIVVKGHLALATAPERTLTLPLPEPQSLTREVGQVVVMAPDSLEVITDEKTVQAAQPLRGQLNVDYNGPHRLTSAWTYTRRPVTIPVTTRRKPTRLLGQLVTYVSVLPDRTDVTGDLIYTVQYAGINTVQFSVPEALAATLQVESTDPSRVAIQQSSRAATAVNGYVTWTVVLQREAVGTIPLRLKASLPNELKNGKATTTLPLILMLAAPARETSPETPLSGLSGELVVSKDRTLDVQGVAVGMEEIDLRELTSQPAEAVQAFRYFRQPEAGQAASSITLNTVRNEIQEVVKTVIQRAAVEAVVTEQKSVAYRCRYLIKSSERQRLGIDLPAGVEPLDVFVAGKSVSLEKVAGASDAQWQSYTVSVARSTPSDQPFMLGLKFLVPYREKPLSGWGGTLELMLPRIGGAGADAAGKTAVQQLRAAVWVPDQYQLVTTPKLFTLDRPTVVTVVGGAQRDRETTTDLETWLGGDIGGLFDFQTGGHVYRYSNLGGAETINTTYWRAIEHTWVFSTTLAVIAVILALSSWSNRISVVLLVLFAGALYSVYDRELVVHAASASRYGAMLAILYWFAGSLRGMPLTRSQLAASSAGRSTTVPQVTTVATNAGTNESTASSPQTPPPQAPGSTGDGNSAG